MRLDGPEATEAVGRALASKLRAGDVVALFGDLGAGKTTLARGILAGLGHDGEVASPTFPIVIPYESLRLPAWHVDLYRIEDPAEIEELALDEALEDGALIVEWPERMGALWPHALRLTLRREGEGARALTAGVPAAWETRWPLP
jgi:tRNA threonylcarbamoyladenosine biosynthesis protein TsaE